MESNQIRKAVFYLDSPVSNSGRLKDRIMELLENFDYEVQAVTIHNVDSVLKQQDHVITSDAIILDNCISWFNLASEAIEQEFGGYPYIDMGISRITE